jgi:hypothetical protein
MDKIRQPHKPLVYWIEDARGRRVSSVHRCPIADSALCPGECIVCGQEHQVPMLGHDLYLAA